MEIVCWDGCFLLTKFGGQLIVICERDGNGELSVLAIGICRSETAVDLAWMMSLFRAMFPELKVAIADQGSAFGSNQVAAALIGFTEEMQRASAAIGAVPSPCVLLALCARHLGGVCLRRYRSKSVPHVVLEVACARTLSSLDAALGRADAISPDFGAELRALSPSLCIYHRLQRGVASDGQTTQSNAESAIAMFSNVRGCGFGAIVAFFLEMCARLNAQRRIAAEKMLLSGQLTTYAHEKMVAGIEKAHKYYLVVLHAATVSELHATISKDGGSTCIVIITRRVGQPMLVNCPCRMYEDCGLLCPRAIFLLQYVRERGPPSLRNSWNMWISDFFHRRHSAAALLQRYTPVVHPPPMRPQSPLKFLRAQMENNGHLPLYPGYWPLRKTYQARPLTGKRRHKSFLEKSQHKVQRRAPNSNKTSSSNGNEGGGSSGSEIVSSCDEGGVLSGDEDGGLRGDESGVLSSDEGGALSGDEGGGLRGDESGVLSSDEGGALSGPESVLAGGVEDLSWATPGGRLAPFKEENLLAQRTVKQTRKPPACSKCGKHGHNSSSCRSGNIAHLLRLLRVYPRSKVLEAPENVACEVPFLTMPAFGTI